MQGSSSTDGGQGITGKEEVGGGGGGFEGGRVRWGAHNLHALTGCFQKAGPGGQGMGAFGILADTGQLQSPTGKEGQKRMAWGAGKGGEQETTIATCLMNYEKQRTGKRGQQGWKESGVHGRAQLNALCDSGRQ